MACVITSAITAQQPAAGSAKKPNVLVIWGDDIGTWNISHNSRGMMGYTTPNIDRIADEGISFTDYYAQQSCTAGRAAFLSGSVPVRSGMTKVGLPGAAQGWQKTDITVGGVMKSLGYHTGQFGKNHQGDRDEHLPTMHGFDEFFGPLYHLNASEEPMLSSTCGKRGRGCCAWRAMRCACCPAPRCWPTREPMPWSNTHRIRSS
jgi:arylsulfatase